MHTVPLLCTRLPHCAIVCSLGLLERDDEHVDRVAEEVPRQEVLQHGALVPPPLLGGDVGVRGVRGGPEVADERAQAAEEQGAGLPVGRERHEGGELDELLVEVGAPEAAAREAGEEGVHGGEEDRGVAEEGALHGDLRADVLRQRAQDLGAGGVAAAGEVALQEVQDGDLRLGAVGLHVQRDAGGEQQVQVGEAGVRGDGREGVEG